MYKVFLNDRLIAITAPEKITYSKPVQFFDERINKEDVKQWFNSFNNSNLNKISLQHPDPAFFFRIFRSAFTELPAAGGVVQKNDRLLFIYRKGKWDLPKGKIDSGESPKEAALREVEEECGITGHRIVKSLPSTFHIYRSVYKNQKSKWIFKETQWFEMSYSGENPGRPETDEGITRIRWFARNELNEVWSNTYENLKLVIGLYRY